MTKQVLFVQGAGAGAHDEWDSKLVEGLRAKLGSGYEVSYPRMPDEGNPRYAAWKSALLGEFDSLADGSVLVGHSIGGAILIQVLAEQVPRRQFSAALFIAAPFIGAGGWPSDEIEAVNLAERLPANTPIYFYQGRDDGTVPFAHLGLYAQSLPHATIRALDGRDHQLNNDLSEVAEDIRKVTGSA
jgi:predicted alpha/beta hydrolase family esterase